jgi:hypothetical protein
MTERLILSSQDFYSAIADAFRFRKELAINKYGDRELRKKSHFIVGLSLVTQTAKN